MHEFGLHEGLIQAMAWKLGYPWLWVICQWFICTLYRLYFTKSNATNLWFYKNLVHLFQNPPFIGFPAHTGSPFIITNPHYEGHQPFFHHLVGTLVCMTSHTWLYTRRNTPCNSIYRDASHTQCSCSKNLNCLNKCLKSYICLHFCTLSSWSKILNSG